MQNSGKHPPPSLYFVIIVLILIGVLGPFISEEFTVPFLLVAATGIVICCRMAGF